MQRIIEEHRNSVVRSGPIGYIDDDVRFKQEIFQKKEYHQLSSTKQQRTGIYKLKNVSLVSSSKKIVSRICILLEGGGDGIAAIS